MSETLKEFVQFISDDPLMLGLCCAIVFLIIVFILVLLFGGRKKKKEEEIEVFDNTGELLKTDVNDEPLRSTQELNLNTNNVVAETPSVPVIPKVEKTQKIPSVDAISDLENSKVAPITLDEALELKNKREENIEKDTIKIPVIEESAPMPVETPVMPVQPSEPVIPELDNLVIPEPEVKVETPIVPASTPVEPSPQPFSSVYVNSSDELPKPDDDFSKTAIIKHIPDMSAPVSEVKQEVPIPVNTSDDLDDIELPKLNTKDETSVLNTLTGEKFDIK